MAGPLRSADTTPLHRYYGPSRHPLVFGRYPGFAGYTAYLAPTISRRDEGIDKANSRDSDPHHSPHSSMREIAARP